MNSYLRDLSSSRSRRTSLLLYPEKADEFVIPAVLANSVQIWARLNNERDNIAISAEPQLPQS